MIQRKNSTTVSESTLKGHAVALSPENVASKNEPKPILNNSQKYRDTILWILVLANTSLYYVFNSLSDSGAVNTSEAVNAAQAFTVGKILDAKAIDNILNSGKTNVAFKKAVSQSETYSDIYPAHNAVDGNRLESLTHTTGCDPWWQVDLGSTHGVTDVVIFNRSDEYRVRLTDFYVGVLHQFSGKWEATAQIHYAEENTGDKLGFHFEPAANGQIVHIHMDGCDERFIHVLQVEVYGDAI